MKIKLLPLVLLFVYASYGQIEKVTDIEGIWYINHELKFKFGDRIFFGTLSPNDFWISDGTTAGTEKINQIFDVSGYYIIGDRCFLTKSNGLYEINPDTYVVEWIANASGTIKNIIPFNNDIIVQSRLSFPNSNSYLQRFDPDTGIAELIFQTEDQIDALVPFNDKILFSYDTNLLSSDGTINGTTTILDNNTIEIRELNLLDGTLFNNQYIFQLHTETYGSEPWATDGTVNGTKLLKDIFPGSTEFDYSYGSFPSKFFNQNNESYFVGFAEGYELSLFKTNGTTEGTEVVFPFREELDIYRVNDLFIYKDEVYLEATSTSKGLELWKTDGTLEGTKLVKDIWKGSGSFANPNIRRSYSFTEDYIYFNGNNGVDGFEIWRTDGTEAGTAMIADLTPGADWSDTAPLAVLDDHFYFIEGDQERDYQIYRFNQSAPLPETPTYSKDYDWFETIGYDYSPNASIPFIYNDEMEVDGADNVYFIGEFSQFLVQFYNSENFVQAAATEEGQFRNFIASYDDKGQFRWAKEMGGHSFGKEQALAIDSENNVICGGVYHERGVIGSVTMDDADNRFFLAKLNSDGDLIWKKQGDVGQSIKAEINHIETDSEGNIYVGGCFTDFNAQVGPHQINAGISPSFFVAKYDKDGNELYLKHMPFPSVELHGFVKSLQVYDENLYVLISDGDYNWSAPCEIRSFDVQLYVLDKDGQIINEKNFKAGDLSFVTDAKFSPSGYLHIIGMFREDFEIEHTTLYTSCEDSRGFVIKLDTDLELIEAFALETPETYLHEIEFGANATYYLSGQQVLDSVPEYNFNYFRNFKNKTFVKKYDKHNQLIDVRYFGKFHYDSFDSKPLISLDSDEHIILLDRYRSSFDTLPVNGGNDMKLGLLKFSLDNQAEYPEDDMLEVEALLLFPNPVAFEITIFSNDEDLKDATFQIYDASGRWILSPSFSYDVGITKIDVNQLAMGLYFLQIKTDEQQFTKKFIKAN